MSMEYVWKLTRERQPNSQHFYWFSFCSLVWSECHGGSAYCYRSIEQVQNNWSEQNPNGARWNPNWAGATIFFKLEIWPQRPMPPSPYTTVSKVRWWIMGGGTFHGGGTSWGVAYPWGVWLWSLLGWWPAGGWHPYGGQLNQRSCCLWNHWSSNTI